MKHKQPSLTTTDVKIRKATRDLRRGKKDPIEEIGAYTYFAGGLGG